MQFLTALLLGLMAALGYLYFVAQTCVAWCIQTHQGIIDGSAIAPYRFRVLAAWIADVMPGGDLAFKYAAAHLLVMPLAFALVYAWLKREAGANRALIGMFVLTGFYLVFHHMAALGLNSQIELGFMAAALLALRRPPGAVYALLIVLGSLNRETTGLILVLLALAQHGRRGLAINVLAFAGVFIGLRLALGLGEGSESVMDILRGNGNPIRLAMAALNTLPFAALIMLTRRGWRAADPLARRRLMIVALVYAPLVIVFGLWDEVRLWLPLVMLALPIVARALSPADE